MNDQCLAVFIRERVTKCGLLFLSLGLVDIRRYRSITSVGKVLPMKKIKILGEVKEFLKFLVIKCVENMKLLPKLCGKCSFPKNFHTRKLGEITVFFVVHIQTTISENC